MLYRASSWYVFGLGLIILSAAASAPSQTGRFRMDYTVAITDVDSRLFHVTANVQNIRWRKGEEKELAVNLGSRTETSYRLTETTQPTPEQSRIREGWLKVVR